MWSIEKIFAEIRAHFSSNTEVEVAEVPEYSRGLFPRLRNIRFASRLQHSLTHITGDIHYVALGLRKKNTLLTIHDLGFMNQYKGMVRFVLWLFWIYIPVRRVRYVVAISGSTKAEIIRYARCNPDKVKIIPDFVSSAFTTDPAPFRDARPVILQIGTKFNKNLERLFEALQGIDCKLIVVGELTDHHRTLIKTRGIDCENRYNLSEEEIVHLYRACDLVTFCSLLEGFGLPILEAQATGRPVVTSNLSSMPEVAGNAACLVDPYDPQSIRAGILKVIRDKEYREELVCKGLENVKRYTVHSVARMYEELYREMEERNNRKG